MLNDRISLRSRAGGDVGSAAAGGLRALCSSDTHRWTELLEKSSVTVSSASRAPYGHLIRLEKRPPRDDAD